LRFEKSKSDRLWEDILLGYISASKETFNNLNGIRMKIRKDCAEIDFWVKNVEDEVLLEQQREWIINLTTLEDDTLL
jgi:hypothetical protein